LRPSRAGALAIGFALLASSSVHAQSSCSSDGVAPPTRVLERFIDAGCETCWQDPKTPKALPRDAAVDWIVPGAQGDEAPLSAGATRDATWRLESLGRPRPAGQEALPHPVAASGRSVRVAHGLPFNGYIGASIEMKPGSGGPYTAWLLLVEDVPAGAEGTPVARRLVRNSLQLSWNERGAKAKTRRLFESRSMSIPEGANPKRLGVVGWVEDAKGRVIAAARSVCAGR
jgi:hypothetical protein